MNVYKTVKYGNSSIRYKVTRSNKRLKTSHIIVEKNSVNVIVPDNKTDQDIKKLVKTNSKWIFTKKLEQKSLSPKNEKTLLYRGKPMFTLWQKPWATRNSITMAFPTAHCWGNM